MRVLIKKRLPDRCQGNRSHKKQPDCQTRILKKKKSWRTGELQCTKDWIKKRKKEGRGGEERREKEEGKREGRETLNRDELDPNWRTKEMREDH